MQYLKMPKSSLPIISIQWSNFNLDTLIDCGSSINLIDGNFFNGAKVKQRDKHIVNKTLLRGEVTVSIQNEFKT